MPVLLAGRRVKRVFSVFLQEKKRKSIRKLGLDGFFQNDKKDDKIKGEKGFDKIGGAKK